MNPESSIQEIYLSQYLPSQNIPQTQISLFDQKIPENIKAFFQFNDLGAFVRYEVSGVNKSFSLSTKNLGIDENVQQVLKDNLTSNNYYLLPKRIQKQLSNLGAAPRRFLFKLSTNQPPSAIYTNMGYFLLKIKFSEWYRKVQDAEGDIKCFLHYEVGHEDYQKFYLTAFQLVYDFFAREEGAALLKDSEWKPTIKDLIDLHQAVRDVIEKAAKNNERITKKSFKNIREKAIFKIHHAPPTFDEYLDQIRVSSYLFNIHYTDLNNAKIEKLEDIKEIADRLWHPKRSDFTMPNFE